MTGPADLRALDGREGYGPAAGQAPAYATREDWLAAAQRFASGRSTASWAFADWLAAGRARWGEAAMREAAEATGNSAEKISNYLCVATVYPPFRRRNGLAFSHHLEVARLPEAEAARILDAALDEGWSHRMTREAARGASLEGRLARALRENADFRRARERHRADPREAAAQGRSRMDAERRVVRDALRRLAAAARTMAEGDGLDGLHGNARLGVAREIERMAQRLAHDFDGAFDALAGAVSVMRERGR